MLQLPAPLRLFLNTLTTSQNMQNTSSNKPQLPSPHVLFPHLFPRPPGQQLQAAHAPHPSQALPSCQSLQRGNHSHAHTGNSSFSHSSSRGESSSTVLPSSNNGTLRPVDWSGTNSGTAAPSVDKKRYACGECGKRFERPSSRDTHMHSHTGERPFKCISPGCEKVFSTKSNMQRHVRSSH